MRMMAGLVVYVLAVCLLCPGFSMAAGLWGTGQWKQEGAVDIFHLVTVRKDGTLEVLATFDGVEGDFAYTLPGVDDAQEQGGAGVELLAADVDGKGARVMVGRNAQGVIHRLRIPAPGPGRHTYRLHLSCKDRIGFREEYDALVWEVGGGFGTAQLARVSCAIKLPEGAEWKERSAWLGQAPGDSAKTYVWQGKEGRGLYRGEAYMRPGERFVATARWGKGVVTPPGIWDRKAGDGVYAIHHTVTVQKDGSLLIEERYTGHRGALAGNFKNSIYTSSTRFLYGETAVEFVSATRDGQPVQPIVRTIEHSGVTTYTILPPEGAAPESRHDYVLRLKTTDCILFDNKDYDTLTWGIERPAAPARVSCDIYLPEGAEVLAQKARLGNETAQHKSVTMWSDPPRVAHFRGEGYMETGQSFAATVRFTKGVVTPTESSRQADNLELWSWVVCAASLLFCTGMWWLFGRDPAPRLVIPRFYPPQLPDGSLLSPAGVAYVRDSARLRSRGFVGLLLNLAVQKALSLSGAGTRKDPYVLAPGHKAATARPAPASPSTSPHNHWNALIAGGQGFDAAEEAVIKRLFAGGVQHIFGRQSTWSMAEARGQAYRALSEQLRGTWRLRAEVVLAMHLIVYVGMAVFLGVGAAVGSGDWAAVCATISLSGLLAWLYHASVRKVHRFLIEWEEMGWLCVVAFIVLCLLLPVLLLYDVLVIPSPDMADFAGRDFMASWQWVRVLLLLALPIWMYRRTRNLAAVFLGPLKFLGFMLGLFLLGGIFWVMNLPGTSGLALLLALVAPTAFLPIMKQPSPQALQLMADIEGFAMYIGTADAHRLETLNQPERTPAEFERVMPYAVALGLERAWSARFTGIAAALHFSGSVGTLDEFQHRLDGV